MILFLSSADSFQNLTFSKISFRNTIRVSNSLDQGQEGHSVGPQLGPNCLQRLSADAKIISSKERVQQSSNFPVHRSFQKTLPLAY